MNGSRFAWLPLHRRDHRQSREPGAALFQGLRVRLTLWYSGVLCAALVLFGVALYFGVQILLLSPVKADLSAHIRQHIEKLLTDPYLACSSTTFGPPAPDQPFGQAPLPELVACFDKNATLLPAENTNELPAAFLTNTLAKRALQEGTACKLACL